MLIIDSRAVMSSMTERVSDQLRRMFPIEGRLRRLELVQLYTKGEEPSPRDVQQQKAAKLEGRTWSVPLMGEFRLVDKHTGQTISTAKDVRLLNLPRPTQRYSYIIGGRELRISNQERLRAGVYAVVGADGGLSAKFNLARGRGFDIDFDPKTKLYTLQTESSHIPLYSVLRALGTDDSLMRHVWGNEIFAANQAKSRYEADLGRYFRAGRGISPGSLNESETFLRENFAESAVYPDTTKITLGKSYTTVSPDTVLRASDKLLKISRGEASPDRTDAFEFKDVLSLDYLLADRLRRSESHIRKHVLFGIDTKTRVRDLIDPSVFNSPVVTLFGAPLGLADDAEQTNPVAMLSGQYGVTLMGKMGGISSEQQVPDTARLFDSSHIGFIDPVHTPEGPRAGVNLRLALGVGLRGTTPYVRLWNLKSKRYEEVTPLQIRDAVVAFPDEYLWGRKGGPVPVKDRVVASAKGNEIRDVEASSVDYVMPSGTNLFSVTSNLVPFMAANQGARGNYATRQIEQAVSLSNPDIPLIQVAESGAAGAAGRTFEKFYGEMQAHKSPVDGTVTKVGSDGITVKDAQGTSHVVELYDHYPLNDNESFLHAKPIVSVGDKVQARQVIADTNFSKGGTLALGKNVHVAYVDYNGYTFDDGIAISEKAAQDFTSQHLNKKRIAIGSGITLSKKRYIVTYPDRISPKQAESLDNDGVVLPGTKVHEGSPLVLALKKQTMSRESLIVRGLHRSLTSAELDQSLVWHGAPGTVQSVMKRGDDVLVFVKTEEPAQVGDKLCYDDCHEMLTRTGWKPVAAVSMDDLVASRNPDTGALEYVPVDELHRYPHRGTLYAVETTQVSMAVTDEHEIWAEPRGGRYGLHRASKLRGRRYRLEQTASWAGTRRGEIVLPPLQVRAGQGGVSWRQLPEIRFRTEDYLALLGMFLSEGSCFDGGSAGCGIDISQTKTRNRRALEQKLTEMGVHFVPCPDRVRIYGVQLFEHFLPLGHAHEKYIPNEIFDLPPEQLRHLYDWLMWGDGHYGATMPQYTTVSRRLADDVQRLVLHLGWAGRVAETPEHDCVIQGKPSHARTRYDVRVIRKKTRPTINHGHAKQQSGQFEGDVPYDGYVYCVRLERNHVLLTRRNGKVHWSGNTNRYGGKGVITRIIPTDEMPRTADGTPIDVMVGPLSVPGRVNLGQVFETALGKVAHKDGKIRAISLFESDPSKRIIEVGAYDQTRQTKNGPRVVHVRAHERENSYWGMVREELDRAGMNDTEPLFDPRTGRQLKDDQGRDPLVGWQYYLKLEHRSAKKLKARSQGPGNPYNLDQIPRGGGPHGAQTIGELGLYALLAHGAVENLREMMSYKSDATQSDAWDAFREGRPMPPPRPTFAFQKFGAMLATLGLNLTKEGNQLTLVPFTDEQILQLSNGELKRPGRTFYSRTLRPEVGGLFDEQITGGADGSGWSHIRLAEAIPNPVFERAIQSLLGLREADYNDLVKGRVGVRNDGSTVPVDDADHVGGDAVAHLLGKIDRDQDLKRAEEAIRTARGARLDSLNRKIRILRALQQRNLNPDVYILKHLPVIPPRFRMSTPLPSGQMTESDLTGFYQGVAITNEKLADLSSDPDIAPSLTANLRAELYDGVKALYGLASLPGAKKARMKGVIAQIKPTKTGFFQSSLLHRKQDMTTRGVIVPEESLGLDEIGVPRRAARVMFEPLLTRKLSQMGYPTNDAKSLVQANAHEGGNNPIVEQLLDELAANRLVVVKRDPVLHQHGFLAFKPRLVDGDVIQIHPLVTGGYGADFDGDQMNLFLPVTDSALEEAYKLLPSRNLFSAATGALMYLPGKSSLIGLHRLSRWGTPTTHVFDTGDTAVAAARAGKIGFTDVVRIENPILSDKPVIEKHGEQVTRRGHWRVLPPNETGYGQSGERTPGRTWVDPVTTTVGRLLLQQSLPETLRTRTMLESPEEVVTKKSLRQTMTDVVKKDPAHFADTVNLWKDLGFAYNYWTGFSFGLDDLKPLTEIRDRAIAAADKKAAAARKQLSGEALDKRLAEIYQGATDEMSDAAQEVLKKSNNRLSTMQITDKPGWSQVRQMLLAPMLYEDAYGNIIPAPARRSYAEGLSAADYFIAAAPARKTIIEKTREVQQPGYLSKQMVNSVADLIVTEADCGTNQGQLLDTASPDVLDRYTAISYQTREGEVPANTLMTPSVASQLLSSKHKKVLMRSPLRCHAPAGICQHCYGLDEDGQLVEIGRNVGILASEAFGERGTQLMLRTFHTGGVAGGGSSVLKAFDRWLQLLQMPQVLPGSATIAESSGRVTEVRPSAAGGNDVFVAGTRHYVPQSRELLVQVGSEVKRGEPLSDGAVNPQELLKVTNSLPEVQNYLANELHQIFLKEGIQRRNAEILVRAVTNLAKVQEPGDYEGLLPGDFVRISAVEDWNRKNPKARQVQFTPILRGVNVLPLTAQEDWIARLQFQKLKNTLVSAAQEGWISDIHTEHPVPALVYSAEFGRPPADRPGRY